MILDGVLTGTVNYHRFTGLEGANDLAAPPLSGQTFGSFAGVNLNLPEGILFDSGSADVKKTGEAVLQKVAKELKAISYQTIVGGFTDNVPISKRLAQQFPSNWDLAASRATNVARMLEGSGVPKGRLVVVSFGENQPVAPNDTVEGRAQDRRIEIRLRPVVVE